MHTTLVRPEAKTYLQRLRFPPEVESAFQTSYYEHVRPTLRVGLFLLAIICVGSALLHLYSDNISIGHAPESNTEVQFFAPVPQSFVVIAFAIACLNVLLLGFAYHPKFATIWQPTVVVVTLFSVGISPITKTDFGKVFFTLYLLVIWCRLQRLQLRWMVLQIGGLIAARAVFNLARAHPDFGDIVGTTIVMCLLMSVPLLLTWRTERFERGEFWAKHVLAQERNDERQKREQSEQMLHVLSQAIGGIVHDLGNPLTSVQTGAETLRSFVKDGETDPELLLEFAEIITDGAQMLNYLRLSLMEQTRVLEGKPVPVEVKPISLRHLIASGAHYQKPKFAAGRNVSLIGEDVAVCVDEMRFITIFMNLIGNALKYSDGEVRIAWRAHERQALIAIQDQGRAGQGLSRDQADKLFVAFGRLETHAQVEGTGLGLLSVRKIAEAHGGEVYIEGYHDGLAGSSCFSTAQNRYPPLLEEGFRTAFIASCPLHFDCETTLPGTTLHHNASIAVA